MKTMKVLTLCCFLSLGFGFKNCQCQISLEHTYSIGKALSLFNLSISGYKWCFRDAINPNSIKIYNMNHSLWKTIPLNPPTDGNVSSCNVSEKLFNDDDVNGK